MSLNVKFLIRFKSKKFLIMKEDVFCIGYDNMEDTKNIFDYC